MKKLLLSTVLVLSFSMGSAFAAAKEITIKVKGMVCGLCAQGIEKKLSAEPSVEKVTVSLKQKQVTLILKEGKELSDETIKKLLNDAGYKVEGEILRN